MLKEIRPQEPARDGEGLPLIGVEEAAQLLGITTDRARQYARAGILPHYASGSHVLFHPAELRRWVAEGRPNRPANVLSREELAEAFADGLRKALGGLFGGQR